MQIVVLGMHRSGTSLVTRLINMMGAYVGPEGICGFNKDNPRGFWERRDVVLNNGLHLKMQDPLWKAIAIADWVEEWVSKQPAPTEAQLRHKTKSIVMNLDQFRPWVMKDPYLCLTLSYWKPLLEVPVCVITHRNPFEIAESMHIRAFNRLESSELGLALWEYYAVGLLNASRDLPRIFVTHQSFLKDPMLATQQLYDALVKQGVQGLRMPSEREVTAFIDPALYRAKPSSIGKLKLTAHQQSLITLLLGEKTPDTLITVSEPSLTLLTQAAA